MRQETDMRENLNRAEARIRELEEQVRLLRLRLTERAESLPNLLPQFYRSEEIPGSAGGDEASVDLVLTVRDTFDFIVPCLESLFANTDVPFRLFLNDNASTDSRTPDYLRAVRDRYPDRVTLFLQKTDLGFPDAVNLMLGQTTNDVILVNADTLLPPNWTSRLLWPIRHSGERVASSAPFSTCTSTGGFPYARQDNELLPNMDTEAVDKIFQLARPATKWTTGYSSGFCMALSRKALDEIGLFDADTYRPAYGEESDWCYRASALGYKHILVSNLFVYHKHGVTFKRQLSTDREKLLQDHINILMRRYPSFEHDLHSFNDNPEYLAFVSFLFTQAAVASGGGLQVCFVPPGELGQPAPAMGGPLLRIAKDPETGEYFLRFSYLEHRAAFTSPDLNWTIKALYRFAIKDIRVDAFPANDEARVRRAVSRLGKHMNVVPRGKDGDEIHEA